eukprot:TRINITY_DN9045_c0_g1_i1.p1 TRINITY_DN9045_c0_g1~~TRINITY_DN9045_c0_g1_i1.p1  ORF type:complete len:927 (+),score=147.34 TRINITY_DN9045_c0_g1_i1:86-2866(+)
MVVTPPAVTRVDASASPSGSGSEIHDNLCSDADDVCVGHGAGVGPVACGSDRCEASETPRQSAAVVSSRWISYSEPSETKQDCGLHDVLLHMTKEDTPIRAAEELRGPHLSDKNSAFYEVTSCWDCSRDSTVAHIVEHATKSPCNTTRDDAAGSSTAKQVQSMAEHPIGDDSLAVARIGENAAKVPERRADGSSSLMDASAVQRVAMGTDGRTTSGSGDSSTFSSIDESVAKVAECLHIDSGGMATSVARERGMLDNGDMEDLARIHDRSSAGPPSLSVGSAIESLSKQSMSNENLLGGGLAPHKSARAIREPNTPEDRVHLIEEVLMIAKEQLRRSAAEQRALLERHQLCFEGQLLRIHDAVQLAMMREGSGIDNIAWTSTRVADDSTRVAENDASRFIQNSSAAFANKENHVDLQVSRPKTSHRRFHTMGQADSSLSRDTKDAKEKKAELEQVYGKLAERLKILYPRLRLEDAFPGLRARIRRSETVTSFSKTMGRLTSSWMFKDLVAVILALYCIMIAFSLNNSTRTLLHNFDVHASPDVVNATTNSTNREEHDDTDQYTQLDLPFIVFFWGEIIMRALAAEFEFFVGPNKVWNMVDLFTIIAQTLLFVLHRENSTNRAIFSIFAFLRIVRVLRSFKELQRLLLIMMHSIKPLFWACIFLFLTIFIFGIFFQLMVNGYIQVSPPADPVVDHLRPLFHSFPQTLVTLFAAVTGGDDWRTIHKVALELGVFPYVIFLIYIWFLTFGVLNLITGIFVTGAIEETSRDRDLATRAEVEKETGLTASLKALFEELDENGSGVITLDEFKSYFGKEDLRAFFQSFGLDVTKPDVIFNLFDVDNNGSVEIDEFVCGCINLRGEAKAVSVEKLLRETREFHKRARRFQRQVMAQLASLTSVGDNRVPGHQQSSGVFRASSDLGKEFQTSIE